MHEIDPVMTEINKEPSKIAKICANTACLKVQVKHPDEHTSEMTSIFYCNTCKTASYCSKQCEQGGLARHKPDDPCAPFEEIVEIDDLWNWDGNREGMGHIKCIGFES
ncbi:hypothetical protein BV25DRAFT_1920850 [Artomyces pyxidatus]|uniref:Uncharacterized protein n=1 Tax=Artomyces pyxidatus TaxID=48021 RepID=A0ACB8SJ57_9AGAM|nr:hypothetical protein BV25DRAFT_1920850 [Artomyces pyxidatus]